MESYDIYEFMILPPNKKAKILMNELNENNPNLNLVSDLIVIGANLDWQGQNGFTALMLCVRWNYPEITQVLIDAGADVNIQDEFRSTALHYCVSYNHLDIARMLIDAGADVNLQDDDGSTALHVCASDNNPEIARMLVDAGADKTIRDNNEKLPYELAESKELHYILKV